ncbi:hypothetical protein TRFO_09931 [Tritrichomonas foetus]|uniref:Uncharacterized protein n=1 Tax=Tritrichomonas foetus TaxID=1144522 RepID=A0A1J4JCX4_9EUKA|nr:hypothetical protein TRFO_09931 [Tritrichomonas foetus]|eukprot:OHS96537.1 hypothetical protein TRFO_09931 [Tritrichomonas foetus]
MSDEAEILPLSGSPNPSHLFTHPNNEQGEYLSSLDVTSDFAMATTSKGQLLLYSMPFFNILNTKSWPNIAECMIQDKEHIIILHTMRPFIYDLTFSVTTSFLKRPTAQTRDRLVFSAGSYFDNLLVGVTCLSTLSLWDVRSSDSPRVLTLPNNSNVQTVSLKNNIIVIGQKNGRISVLDARNMKQRLNQIDIASQIVGTNVRHEFEIVQNQFEPWTIGFQFSSGPAGIVDLMTKKVTHQINQPLYTATTITDPNNNDMNATNINHNVNINNNFNYNVNHRTKLRPVFYRNSFCVGYSWSKILQVVNFHDFTQTEKFNGKLIELSACPASISAPEDVDGIFVATSGNEIYQVF